MDQVVSQILTAAKGVWKYRWYAMSVSWLVIIAGFVVVYSIPNNFQSSARVFVDTQSILKPILSSMATIPDVDQQVAIMSNTLLSRPNIERVIRMVDLDLKAQTLKEKEAMINSLTKEIKIAGTPRNDIYSISYHHADPKLATAVVQSLLTIFIEGSFGDKKKESASAIRFIDEQIKQYEEKLVSAENGIKEFKQKYSTFGSGKEGEFNGRLAQIEEQLSQAKLELNEAEQARNSIKRQVTGEQMLSTAADGAVTTVSTDPELDERINALNKNLDNLRLQFTDQHPDVIATSRLIAQLEARKVQEAKARRSGDLPPKSVSPVIQQLKIALSDAEARVASMRARVGEYASRAALLRSQARAMPEIEAEFTRLNRDYEVNKTNYEKLIASRDAARLSGDLSATAEMISFRIIDPPTAPVKPVGPNRPQLITVVFLAALAAGIGIGFVMSQIRPSFMSFGQLRELSGIPVLGSVSMNWTAKEKKRRKKSLVAFSGSFAGIVGLYIGALAFFFAKA